MDSQYFLASGPYVWRIISFISVLLLLLVIKEKLSCKTVNIFLVIKKAWRLVTGDGDKVFIFSPASIGPLQVGFY